jgi:predicted enzyme related to lactoylglutathione lyase
LKAFWAPKEANEPKPRKQSIRRKGITLLGHFEAAHDQKEDVDMEVLSSRVLLRPTDFERSFRFYARTLGLHVYREWGSGPARGVVFFLGGGFLELSGSSEAPSSEKVSLWLQVPDVDGVGEKLESAGVEVLEPPTDKQWGLREMRVEDPDGVRLVIVEVPKDHPLRRP